MEYFTVVVDTPLGFNGTASPPHEIYDSLARIKTYCESKNIIFFQRFSDLSANFYFDYQDDNLSQISKDTEKTFYNKAFYLILTNEYNLSENKYKVFKNNPSDDLTVDIEFNDLAIIDNYTLYAEKLVGYYNIIPIVLEFNMLLSKWHIIIIDFIRRLRVKHDPLSESLVDFRLERQYFTNTFTLGKLFKNNEPYCFTVEDTVRFSTEKCNLFNPTIDYPSGITACTSVKKTHYTAVPCGTYKVQNIGSKNFWCINTNNRLVPKLLTIGNKQPPCFTEIAMHSGSSADSSSGCIIMSTEIYSKEHGKVVNNGRALMDDIYLMLKGGYGKIEITQKIDGEDLNQNHIEEMKKGKVFGDIDTVL